MGKQLGRVSQDQISDVIARAVELEARRIEQLDAAQVEAVDGGLVRSSTQTGTSIGGTTVGMFPPPSDQLQ